MQTIHCIAHHFRLQQPTSHLAAFVKRRKQQSSSFNTQYVNVTFHMDVLCMEYLVSRWLPSQRLSAAPSLMDCSALPAQLTIILLLF